MIWEAIAAIYLLLGGALIWAAVPGGIDNATNDGRPANPLLMMAALVFILIFWLPLLMLPIARKR